MRTRKTWKLLSVLTGVVLCVTLGPQAAAQNTGGVFPPRTPNDHTAVQYRTTYDDDSSRVAQRLHYESTPNDSTMWRVVAQGRKTDQSDLDFDFVQGELFLQHTPDGARLSRGARFDLRVRDRGRPLTLAAHYMTEYAFSDRWSGRLVGLSFLDVGDGGRDGVQLETRANVTYHATNGSLFGIESYNRYGSTDKIKDFKEQGHEMGPFWMHRFDNGMMVFAGALYGLTDATTDRQYRLWIDWALR